ncbi:hypothetical protein SFB61_03180 [Legionella pneumophila]|nr:hypothetical protein [Legionella pneumophila]MDW8905957.1 hypothetical protein [Legionella pneumophila]
MIYINEPLERSIKVNGYTRPIKITYIISPENNPENHLILDAIFSESYARWCGCETLIIPATSSGFLNPEYERWLAFFDPDFVCTYIDLDAEVIKKISSSCHPSTFIRHKPNRGAREGHYKYSVDWRLCGGVEEFVSSISTICALKGDKFNWQRTTQKTIVTQFEINAKERFISDNFGTTYRSSGPTYPVDGLFETYLLDFDNNDARSATKKTDSIVEILSSVAKNESITFYELASSCRENISKISTSCFGQSLQLFIGDSCLDRINFWNARHLTQGAPGSIIVNESLLENKEFIKQLGLFLNNHNFLTNHGNQPHVELRSHSLNRERLQEIQKKLQQNTFNFIIVPQDIAALILPRTGQTGGYVAFSSTEKHTYKLDEKVNEDVAAQEPSHFQLMPMVFKALCKGQWAIDLEIERVNNLSRLANSYDIWRLPKREAASRCFTTKNISRVTNNHLLSLIPEPKSVTPFANNDKGILRYFLNIPSDENFFRCLFLDDQYGLFQDDLRLPFKTVPYQKLSISDKGQYLRGVIAKFKSLDEAYEILVSKFWRDLIRGKSKNFTVELKKDKNKDVQKEVTTEIITENQMFSALETNAQHKINVKKQMRFSNKEVMPYIRANFMDSLEYLVHKNIIFRVHDWRCHYCGRINAVSIDNLKNKNNCEVCDSSYELPVDFKCAFKLNDFVVNALSKNNGMTVLWTLGFLHNRNYNDDFFYIPEVRLFDKYDDKEWAAEIDVICVLAGKLYVGEVKKSAAAFVNNDAEVNKFIEIIKRLTPDVALLSFEQYGDKAEEIEEIKEKLQKTKEKIEKCGIPIEVKILVANEHDQEFGSYAISLYPSVGVRSEKYWR